MYHFPSRIAAVIILLTLPVVGWNAIRARETQSAEALDAKEPITYFIADGSGKSGYRASDRELALWALEAWQRGAGSHLRLAAAPESKALVYIQWAEPSEGEYGETRPLTIDGRRGAAVYVRPDMNSLGDEIAMRARTDDLLRESIVYLTCLHEIGHAFGLDHTRDFRDIMYYFGYGGNVVEYFYHYRKQIHKRADIATVSGLSEADVSHIRELYAGE